MNETKKAIEHFHYGITHDIFSEPVTTYARLAVEALREQAERSKGCDLCMPVNTMKSMGAYGRKFMYCPMCGKSLEEATNER